MKTAIDSVQIDGCCKVQVLHQFGGGEMGDSERYCSPKADIIEDVKSYISSYKRRGDTLMVTATTASNQPQAYEALEELGFTLVSEASYDYYDDDTEDEEEQTVYFWLLNLKDYKG